MAGGGEWTGGERLRPSGGARRPGCVAPHAQAGRAGVLGELAVEVPPELEQLREGPCDDVEAGARRAAGRAWEVADRQLLDAEAEAAGLDEELGAERRPAR